MIRDTTGSYWDIIVFVVLRDDQLERYSRQMILSGVGGIGQEKLLSSSVLVLGAGGLGSGVLSYLSCSGVGTLGIIDFDNVELSNLHRQIIHNTCDVGKPKIISAREKIQKQNPDVNVVTFKEKLNKSNIGKIFSDFEIIVDGLDNFDDKFLVNDYCVLLNKKLVHAGATGFEGQVLTVIPHESACLRCYFPDKPPGGMQRSCRQVGVLGTCVGVISVLQANEVLKLILGIGKLLVNRVLKYNALDESFYEFKIPGKNKDCPICTKALKT